MSTSVSYSDKVDYRRRAMIASIVPNYFATEAIVSGTFTFTYPTGVPTGMHSSISYSLDGKNWVTTNNVDSQAVTVTTPTIPAGGKVYWKGTGYGLTYQRSNNNYAYFTASGNFNVSGNIMSLIYGDSFEGKLELKAMPGHASDGVFYTLFFGSRDKLISAEKLLLPATTLVERAYQDMFSRCHNLVDGPKILPATTLFSYCYANMFYECSKLEKAPVLPAETLFDGCYYQMFYKNTQLNYIKAMFTNADPSSVSQAINHWVSNVTSSGTFVKNRNATWENTTSGVFATIPVNFTVVTE